MDTINWTSFTRKIAIKASPETIYNAWTTASGIEKWFLSHADFYKDDAPADRDENVQQGFTYAWQWYLFDETEKGKITAANGKDILQFTFAGECLVDIALIRQGEYTIVSLTQKNIPTDDASKKGIRLGCDAGWSFYLVNLKSVYEGGLDLRNKDARLKVMVNN